MKITKAPGSYPMFEHCGPAIHIGRAQGCDLAFRADLAHQVSREHARIDLAVQGASVRDLNSTNGTFLNDQRVDGVLPLQVGDRIRLGHSGPVLKIRAIDLSTDQPRPGYRPVISMTRQMLISLQKREQQTWLISGITLVGLFLGLVFLCWRLPAATVSATEVNQNLLRSTCWILEVPEPNARSARRGTGFLVNKERKWVLTTYNVVHDRLLFLVCFPAPDEKGSGAKQRSRGWYLSQPVPTDPDQPAGRHACWHYARVKYKNPERDLALFELGSLPDDVHALKLAPQSSHIGRSVFSLGNPEAGKLLWVYTESKVRQMDPERSEMKLGDQVIKARTLLTQSTLDKGDSGGALVNDRCEVVGVVSRGQLDAQEMDLGIDVTEIRAFLAEAERKSL